MRKAIVALTALALTASLAYADMPVDTGLAASVPMSVLSPDDISLYRRIFDAERDGRFDDAKKLFAQLNDTSLEGYVLAEHYLSRHGHADLSDLISWLKTYPDLPIADRIYKLAVARASKKVHKKHHKTVIVMTASVPVPSGGPRTRGGGYEEYGEPDPPLNSDAGKAAKVLIDRAIKADQPDEANNQLRQAQLSGASDYDLSRLAQRVAMSYLIEGMDQRAYDTSMGVRGSWRTELPVLDWIAGFAAYRLGNYEDAAARLEVLAQSSTVPNYLRSQGAFWAARAHLRFGDPQRVITLLQAAAREEPTFYGILAERILGQDTQTGFVDPVLTASDFSAIMAVPSAHRAVALYQVGEETSAIPQELNRAFGESDGGHDMGYAAIARRIDAPNIELRASETVARSGRLLTGLFPVPQYKPTGGYTVDPALVLAFVRAESRFHANAISAPGARGLMQLMPGTAVKFGGNGSVSALTDPSYNMSIGQRYVAYLLDNYGGNLIHVMGAYNAGPLRVAGWVNAMAGREDDPLVFIESMRISETRIYVKRVMMYDWLYSRRLNQTPPSLEDMVAGRWPIYHPPSQPPAPKPPAPSDDAPPPDSVISDARY